MRFSSHILKSLWLFVYIDCLAFWGPYVRACRWYLGRDLLPFFHLIPLFFICMCMYADIHIITLIYARNVPNRLGTIVVKIYASSIQLQERFEVSITRHQEEDEEQTDLQNVYYVFFCMNFAWTLFCRAFLIFHKKDECVSNIQFCLLLFLIILFSTNPIQTYFQCICKQMNKTILFVILLHENITFPNQKQ